ncbi:MAG TPA: ATPase [Methanocella sp.]|nr:ATPase [Methanocella sp.]
MVDAITAIGIGLAVGLAGIGTGLAQGPVGAGVVGAVAEDRSFLGMGFVLMAFSETVVIFGMLFGLLLMFMA